MSSVTGRAGGKGWGWPQHLQHASMVSRLGAAQRSPLRLPPQTRAMSFPTADSFVYNGTRAMCEEAGSSSSAQRG